MIIVGHRGARGLAPENTLASFEKAIEHHVDMLECDLRVTKDQKVILHHDKQLKSPVGEKYLISDYTLTELQKLKPDLLSFEDFINVFGKQSLYLEIKPGVEVDPIIRALEQLKPKNFMIGSKSQKILKKVHKKLPAVELIVIHPWSGVIAARRARQVGSHNVAFNQICLWGGFIRAVARNDYKIYAYTLNDHKKAKKWQKAGLYGVITDYPDLFDN